MPMGQMSEQGSRNSTVEGGTNYGEAFRVLAQSVRKTSRSSGPTGTGCTGRAPSS